MEVTFRKSKDKAFQFLFSGYVWKIMGSQVYRGMAVCSKCLQVGGGDCFSLRNGKCTSIR